MNLPRPFVWCALCLLTASSVQGQKEPLLPEAVLTGIANTVSGSRPLQTLIDFTGYNRDRSAAEYQGTWLESELFARKAKDYGFSEVEILRYEGRPVWDGQKGELWVTSPILRKIVDFKDIPTALAPGSVTGEYEGRMIWIESADDPSAYGDLDVTGSIVLTAAGTRSSFRRAIGKGALGVVNMNSERPFSAPDAIVWSSIGRAETGFAFNISAPILEDLRQIARRGEVTLKAIVQADWMEVDNEVITAVIPGDGSTDEWVYLSAHVFEGINKQGAADDGSGAVLILEAGRTILESIEKGYVRRPARSLRFLWVDEFSGTFAFLDSHQDEFQKVVADLNIDMAGQNTETGQNATRLYRMPHSRIHYVADVAEEFFHWVGITNIERVHERSGGYGFRFPILDPYGSRDPFRFWVDPFYGSSDHQVYNDRGVPAILFNHWPDLVYHSSHDRPDRMDATQMKRVAFITAATTLVVAGAPEIDPLQVAYAAFGRGRERISRETAEWSLRMGSLPTDALQSFRRDMAAALPQWYKREQRNLQTVLELARGSTTDHPDALIETVQALQKKSEATLQNDADLLQELYAQLARSRGLEPEAYTPGTLELEAEQLVPVAVQAIPRRRSQGLPGFAGMEVRNFMDGQRSVLEIRNAVNSEYRLEYGSLDLKAVLDYFRNLEEEGFVTLKKR